MISSISLPALSTSGVSAPSVRDVRANERLSPASSGTRTQSVSPASPTTTIPSPASPRGSLLNMVV